MKSFYRIGIIFIVIILLFLLVFYFFGNSSNENKLEIRVEKYYEALKNQDYATTYDMEHQFIRESFIKDEYINSDNKNTYGIVYFLIDNITIKDTTAKVELSMEVIYNHEKMYTQFSDYWIYENNNWYHAPN
ncbi:MAG: hypothetical protein ABFQ65_00390 [Nanoarchaeota archaeon]